MEEKVIGYLEELLEKSRPKDVYVIEYKGQRLTMPSNKSSWATLGAAKNALRYGMPYFYEYGVKNNRLEVIKELEDKEIIKYIKL